MISRLESRLSTLEKRNRLLVIGMIALSILVIVAASGRDVSNNDTLRCQRLEVVNAEGKLVAMVGVDPDGSRGLFVHDADQCLRLATIHDSTQTAWYAFDTTGTIRVGVAQYAHGGGGFALHGIEAKGATVLYHKESGSLTFYGEDGSVIKREP